MDENKSPGHLPNAFGPTVLVDTSLLIEQQKRESAAEPVRAILAVYRFRGASSYSKLEFKRAWLQRLGYLHTLCRHTDIRSVPDVMARLNRNLANSFQMRRVQTCLDMLIAFLDAESDVISRAAQLARLRAHCKNSVLSAAFALEQMVTGFFTHTGCVRAEERAVENADGSLTLTIRRCSPEHIQCSVHRFFQERQATFESIARSAREDNGASAELRAMADHIDEAVKISTHLCDDRNCSKIADSLVAVDGRDMSEFAANNDAEWVPISKIMRKPLSNPVTGGRWNPTVPEPR